MLQYDTTSCLNLGQFAGYKARGCVLIVLSNNELCSMAQLFHCLKYKQEMDFPFRSGSNVPYDQPSGTRMF